MTSHQEDAQTENVRVAIRIRPFNAEERATSVIAVDEEGKIISLKRSGNHLPRTFKFDNIFQENSTQIDVYRTIASPIVEKVFQGYNGTIFAYGQTGTGKTYTMVGENFPDNRGIVPNTFGHIFSQISTFPEKSSFVVTATYLEIYNEEVRDLLSTNPRAKLEVRERADIGVYVKNLTGFTVDSIQSITDLMNRGSMNRSTSATLMNSISSRSHAIFSITIESKFKDQTTLGKLNLVDLAGSERLNRTHATGDRLREASNINQSLSALGNVISALIDEKSTYIPYRNSKLTRLLQDSLGGNSKTAMIAMISPSEDDYEESLCTLRYASRVKFIKNNVKVNVETKKGLIESFEEEIRRLRKRISIITLYEEKANNKKKITPSEIDYQRYDRELEHLQTEKENVLGKLSLIQKKILVGGENLLEKAQRQIYQIEESNSQLADLDKTHQELEEQIEEVGAAKIDIEEKYYNLQDEDKALNEKIELMQKLLKEAKHEHFEKHHEYQREIANLTTDYRTRMKEIKLADNIVKNFIPAEKLAEIEEKIVWNEEINDYQIQGIAYAGNNVNGSRSLRRIEESIADTEVGNPFYNYGSVKYREKILKRLKNRNK